MVRSPSPSTEPHRRSRCGGGGRSLGDAGESDAAARHVVRARIPGALLLLGIAALGLALAAAVWRPDEPPRPVVAAAVGEEEVRSVARLGGDSGPTAESLVRTAVGSLQDVTASDANPDGSDSVPWDPANLTVDPAHGTPVDFHQFLHWHILGNPLLQGERLPARYELSVETLCQDVALNVTGRALTDAQLRDLRDLLEPRLERLRGVAQEEWRQKALGMHKAVERGDYLAVPEVPGPRRRFAAAGRPATGSVDEGVLAELRRRYGEDGTNFATVGVSLPIHVEGGGARYVVFVDRSAAPEAFAKQDEANRLLSEARAMAAQFFATLAQR